MFLTFSYYSKKKSALIKAYELEMKRLDLNRQAASLMNKMNTPKVNTKNCSKKVKN